MTIKLVDRGSEGELLLDGGLDGNTMPETEAIFAQAAQRFDRVVVNLTLLSYVSTNSLRSFKKLHMAMRQKGGQMVLKNVSRPVMEVFEVTGFAGLFKFE